MGWTDNLPATYSQVTGLAAEILALRTDLVSLQRDVAALSTEVAALRQALDNFFSATSLGAVQLAEDDALFTRAVAREYLDR